MELINDRYRVNQVQMSELYGSEICASDLLRYGKAVRLLIQTAGPENGDLLQYLNTEFVRLSQFNHPVLNRFRRFSRVTRIDGSVVLTERYLLVSDQPGEGLPLSEVRDSLSFTDCIRLICELASALQFVHDRGFCLGAISSQSIRFIHSESGWQIRYLGLPAPEALCKNLYASGHRSHASIRGKDQRMPDAQSDILSLGLLFFSMLSGVPVDAPDFEQQYENIYTSWVNDPGKSRERKCMSFIGQMLRPDPHLENRLEPSDLIQGLNGTFGTSFPLFDKDANSHMLVRVPLIDRNGQYATMIHQGLRYIRNNRQLRIQLIRGAAGTGKTRLVEELRFQSELKGISCYSVESTGALSQSLCNDLVRILLNHPDPALLSKYGPELVKLFPEHPALQHFTPSMVFDPEQEEMRNRSRLLSFIADSLKSKPSVVLVENLHLSRPECMLMLEMLTGKLMNQPIWIVATYATDRESALLPRITQWMETNGVQVYEKGNFDPNETTLFIKRMLGLKKDPALFSDHVHRETGGNPELIRKFLMILVQDGLLFLDRVGRWTSKFDSLYSYSSLQTSVTFEQSLHDSIQQMSNEERTLLRALALMQNPVSLPVISLMTGLPQDEIMMLLADLTDRQYVLQQVNDLGYLFGIKSIQQRQTILHGIPQEEQRRMHAETADILSAQALETDSDLTDELIFQYSKSEQGEKVVRLCMAAAERMIRHGAMQHVYDYIDTGIRICRSSGDVLGLSDLLMRKARLYHDTALFEDEVNLLTEADEILLAGGYARDRLRVLFQLFFANHRASSIMEAERVLSEIEHETALVSSTDAFDTSLSAIHILHCRAMLASHRGHPEEALDLAGQALQQLEDLAVTNGSVMEDKGIDQPALLLDSTGDAGITGYLDRLTVAGGQLIVQPDNGSIPALMARIQETSAWQMVILGNLEDALSLYGEALTHHVAVGNNFSQIRILQLKALACATVAMDAERCSAYLQKADALRTSVGDSLFASGISGLTGIALVLQERYRDATPILRRDLFESADGNTAFSRILLYMNLMEAWARLGDFEAAHDAIRAAAYQARGSELPVHTAVWIEMYSMHFHYLLWDAAGLRRSAIRMLDTLGSIQGDARTEASFFLYLSELMSTDQPDPTGQPDPAELADWISVIGQVQAPHRRHDLWIALASLCASQGRFLDLGRILSRLSAGSQRPGPWQQLEIDYLKALSVPPARRAASLTRFISRLPHDAVRIRYLACAALFSERMSAGDFAAAMETGTQALREADAMVHHMPDLFLSQFLSGSGALRLQSRLLDLQRDQHFTNRQTPLSEMNSGAATEVLRNEWIRSVQMFAQSSSPLAEDLHRIASPDPTAGDPLEALVQRIAERLRANWMVFAQFTAEGRLQVLYRSEGLSADMALAVAEEYGNHTDFFAYGNLNLLQADSRSLPEDTIAVAGLGLTGEPGSVLHREERRKIPVHVARRGVLIYGTKEIYHVFTSDEGRILDHLAPLITTLLENHILLTVSNIDRLTGLFTRKYMEETLNQRFAFVRENRENLSILMLDIDHFKAVNDTFGHQRGDDVLQGVAAITMENCRKQDICCRFGGEEVMIILPETGAKQARVIAERIRRSIEDARLIEGHPLTASIGVATYPDHGDFQDEIVLHADMALYHAKNTGRNKTALYSRTYTKTSRASNRREAADMFSLLQEERIMHNYNAIFDLLGSRLENPERMQAILDRLSNVVPVETLLFMSTKDIRAGRTDRHVCLKRSQDALDRNTINLPLLRSALRAKAARITVEMARQHTSSAVMVEFSQMGVPVLHRQEVTGVLFFHTLLDDHEYDGRDRNIAQLFADLIGLAEH